jgi:hypothetical protein
LTPAPDPWFLRINEFARDTPWLIGFWATRPVLVRLLRRAEDTRLVRPLLTVADTAEWSSR